MLAAPTSGMTSTRQQEETVPHRGANFTPTHWSVVLAAAGHSGCGSAIANCSARKSRTPWRVRAKLKTKSGTSLPHSQIDTHGNFF
jgi:hypothetical protein